MKNILELKDLAVSFDTPAGVVKAVRGVSLEVKEGEILCIAGESGCGKTVLCQSIMHLLPSNSRIEGGQMIIDGKDITNISEKEIKKIRTGTMSMIFQDPLTTLNPTIPIGKQITDVLIRNKKMDRESAKKRAVELLRMVEISDPEKRFGLQPHFFSGGMRQRCVLAVALASDPKILFADEATTALDVTVEAKILDLLLKIRDETGIAIIYVSHDLGSIARIADRVAIMYAGKIVETGTAGEIFYDPHHPYTWGLLSSMPSLADKSGKLKYIPGMPPSLLFPKSLKDDNADGKWFPLKGDAFAERNPYAMAIDYEAEPPMFRISDTHYAATWLLDPRAPKIEPPESVRLLRERRIGSEGAKTKTDTAETMKSYAAENILAADKEELTDTYIIEAKGLKQHFIINHDMIVKAVDGVSFGIRRGEIFGLVGETGCGKSTIARTLSGIYKPTEGEIFFEGERISGKKQNKDIINRMHTDIQMIFQDNAASLNPRMTVRQLIEEPLRIRGKVTPDTDDQIKKILKDVGLQEELLIKLPSELSGGQRQRVAIARSLIVDPKLIIADEPVASLDISIQAQIITLFKELQDKRHFSFLFIAHDLSVVRYISDRVGVMLDGRLAELAYTEELFGNPVHPYTKALLSSIHIPDPDREKSKVLIPYDRSKEVSTTMKEIKPEHLVAI